MNLSFDITNSRALFQKLTEDYQEYSENDLSSRLALNCAMTAWHLVEWIYHEHYTQSIQFNSLADFQAHLKILCPSLQIMHDLTNGTKHRILDRHKTEIKNTQLHKGTFDRSFSRDFDISSLEIEMQDGSIKYFEDEIKLVYEFWKDFLENHHNMS